MHVPLTIEERIDRVTAIPEAYRGTILPPPVSCKIELTGYCNFACTFCARSQKLRQAQEMDRAFYKRIIKEMRHLGVQELGLFYLGESLMCKWLTEAIVYAKELGYFTFLTTNGSLCTQERLNSIMHAGLDSLKFSLNYADAEQFSAITKVKPAVWNRVKQAIIDAKWIRDHEGYPTQLSASYILYDGEQGKKMQEVVRELSPYVDSIYALPLYNQAALVTEQEKAQGWKPSPGNRGRADALRDPLPCWAPMTEAHITADGLLSACCFDHNASFTMGDLNKVTFMEAWNSEFAQKLRAAHLKKDVSGTPCENCMVS